MLLNNEDVLSINLFSISASNVNFLYISSSSDIFIKTEALKQEDQLESEQKKKKQAIPKSVKTIVWDHYIGKHINSHRCLCCKKVLIEITTFDVGHVISEKEGGTLEINNLRPICAACNHSMGAMNMIEFVKNVM